MTGDGAKSFRSVLVPLCFGAFLSTLSSTTIYVALPVLTEHFQVGLAAIQWAITGFLFATGLAAPLAGYLGDRFSYKRAYVFSMAGFAASSALCALSWNISVLIAARVMQGFFSGLLLPVTMAIIHQIVPRNRQPLAVSIWGSATLLAPAFGPVISGLLVQYGSWEWIFWMNVPMGVIALVTAVRLIPYYRLHVPKSMDLIGLILVTASSLALLVVFGEAARFGWLSRETFLLAVFGTIGSILFFRWEWKRKEPLLDVRVFRYRTFSLSLLVLSVITLALYAGIYLTPIFLQNVQNLSSAETGWILLPISLVMAAAMPFIGAVYNRVGPYRILFPSAVLICAGTFAMGNLYVTAGSLFVIGWMTVRNVGIAVMNRAATSVGMEAVPRELAGHASAFSNWVRQMVSAWAIGCFTSVLEHRSAVHEHSLLAAWTGIGSGGHPWTESGGHELLQTGTVSQQALTMAINELFLWSAAVSVVVIPIVWFMRRQVFHP